MGLFQKLFGNMPKPFRGDTFRSLTGYTPQFKTWNGELYESDLVRRAIGCKAEHFGKLKINIVGPQNNSLLNYLKMRPNSWQTWPQFLERFMTILEMQNNAFIVPVIEQGKTVGYYPVLPSKCDLIEYDNTLFIRYHFRNGQTGAVEYSRCSLYTKYQYEDDFFGAPNTALNDTISLIDLEKQAIREAAKNSNTFRFMARMSNFSDEDDMAQEQARFNKSMLQNENGGGVLLFPNEYTDVKQLTYTAYAIDAKERELIQENVFTYFGVNMDVLQNKANGDVLDAFYNGALEPVQIKLSEGFTFMVQEAVPNCKKVSFIANRLQYMTTANKISFSKELGAMGCLMIDEIRELNNYEPLPDGLGQQIPVRGEFYMLAEGKESEEKDGQSPAED